MYTYRVGKISVLTVHSRYGHTPSISTSFPSNHSKNMLDSIYIYIYVYCVLVCIYICSILCTYIYIDIDPKTLNTHISNVYIPVYTSIYIYRDLTHIQLHTHLTHIHKYTSHIYIYIHTTHHRSFITVHFAYPASVCIPNEVRANMNIIDIR